MTKRTARGVCTLSLLAATVALGGPASSQERAGVVTAVVGPVTVARTSMPSEALKFKDDVFINDRVTTGDDAITRILLGGKVVVTARERTTLTITEVPGLSTIDLASGRIAVAVDKSRMKPGERVDVRTPNAIAGVRGTVLVVESVRDTSTITVLRGLVDVMRLDARTGRPVGAITPVGALQAVNVRNNVLPARAHAITPTRSQELSKEFTPPLRSVPSTDVVSVKDELKRASNLVNTAPEVSVDKPGRMNAGAKEGKEGVGGVTAPMLSAAPLLTTPPGKTNTPNYGSSLLNTSSPRRLSTTTTP